MATVRPVLARARATGDGPRTTHDLPADLLHQASGRLALVSLIYAGTYFLAFSIGLFLYLVSGMRDEPYPLAFQTTLASVSIAMSLGMYWLTRRKDLEPRRLLRWALGYEVAGALGISAGYWGIPAPLELPMYGLSWVCVWIIVFPLIVPSTPRRTLVFALLSASTSPLVVFVSWVVHGLGAASIRTAVVQLLMLSYPNYICVGIAYFASRVMYGLGKAVREARELGSYQLVEILGRGGMGEVWRARHRMLARPAAIKLLRADIVGAGDTQLGRLALRRFELEAQATAGLRSPHTIELYDFGSIEDGTFYYVMELLDGLDLETLVLRHGPLPPGRVIHLLRQICHSLDEAHRAGMVHRDIKPANVYTCRLGLEVDFVKVLDFGIVKSTREAAQPDARLTQEGAISGTPAYMAPEAALGGAEIDGRADLYSLGCVAYWLLRGKTVFETPTSMGLLLEHVRTPPVPPSQRLGREIPPDLEAIVLACLEKDRGARPQSARELSSRLAACTHASHWTAAMAEEWWAAHQPAVSAADSEDASSRVTSPAEATVTRIDPLHRS